MWSGFFGQQCKITPINFEDIQDFINKDKSMYFLINTLPIHNQKYVISGTVCAQKEEERINECLKKNRKNVQILVYGMNCNDITVNKKCNDLVALGFTHVKVYLGGLFEWLLLRDIYGHELFPLNVGTDTTIEILDYKPPSVNYHQ